MSTSSFIPELLPNHIYGQIYRGNNNFLIMFYGQKYDNDNMIIFIS